jgi:predicted kinase
MPTLYIMRGLPGSGKSEATTHIYGATVCSADDFFMVDGEYVFQPHLIGKAHAECQVKALKAMGRGQHSVVIDNTNTQKWEYAIYLAMAEVLGYEVCETTVGGRSPEEIALYAERNTHGVPLRNIQAMADRWEE